MPDFTACAVVSVDDEGIGAPFLDIGDCNGDIFPHIDLELVFPACRPIIDLVACDFCIRRRAPGDGYLCGVGNCGKEKKQAGGDKAKSRRGKQNPAEN